MKFNKAKEDFIKEWGVLGKSWGIGKTMAEIHALLLISPFPCSKSYIEKQLRLSSFEADKGIQDLLEWEVIQVDEPATSSNGHVYYKAEKDVWLLAQLVAKKRREKELVPIIAMLERVQGVENDTELEHYEEFKKVTGDMSSFASKADKFLNRFANANGNWFFKQVLSWIR